MRKSHLTLARASVGVLAAGALAAALVVPGIALASSSSCSGEQCFAVTVSSVSAPAGATTTFTFTITNQSSVDPLNAVTITAPAPLEIIGAAAPDEPGADISGTFPAGSVTIGTAGSDADHDESGSATAGALSLAPGGKTAITVTAAAPCVATDSTYIWGIQATKDGDNDSDDFQLNANASPAPNLAGAITGSCYLAFATAGQPANTVVNHQITAETDSQGGPVEVDVMSAAGTVMTNSTAQVGVDIASSTAASPSLSGTATASAINGVASFSNLSINETGTYTLGATTTSSGILGGSQDSYATSAAFDISDSIVTCSSPSCTTSASDTTTTGSVSTSSASAGDFLELGVGGVSYSCAGYTTTSDPVSFDLYTSGGVPQTGVDFTAVLEVSKAAVEASGHPGASSWQICYASTAPFTAQPGTAGVFFIGTTEYFTGLLPDCASATVAPCVESRHKDNAGNEVVTFLATGDPVYKG